MSINRKDNRLAVGEASFNDLLSRYKRGAQERDLLFDLTVEEFRELTSAKCSYCGIEPAQINHKSNTFGAYIYNGIDRIDNSLGYIKSNCISCCERCNEWKRALTKNEFLNHVKRIYLCMLQ
jgi:5-methylcytosine-specific restriction endonuclease McrA